jgi:Uma2 family endonuclease
MGVKSNWVATRLVSRLDRFCEAQRIGWALTSEAGYQCFPHEPERVRKPDVSFIRYGRLPGGVLPEGWAKIPPDLAVEVVSPNDLVDALDEKLQDYEKAGVPLIWVIYLGSRQVMVYRGDGSVSRLRENDEISGEDVIPGFRCTVREILPTREPAADAPSNANGSAGDA